MSIHYWNFVFYVDLADVSSSHGWCNEDMDNFFSPNDAMYCNLMILLSVEDLIIAIEANYI